MVRDRWFGGPGQVKKSGKQRLLVVMDPRLFAIRDKKGNPTEEWSLDTLRKAAEKWDVVAILERRSFKKEAKDQNLLSNCWAASGDPGNPKNVHILLCGDSVVAVTEQLKKLVLDSGGKIKPVRNPREITYLNMDKFVDESDNITWIRSWDQIEQLGIEPEKPKSFDDLKKDRGKKSFW